MSRISKAQALKLLSWFDRHRRTLPWRGPHMSPYKIWLSEMMLQQTTVFTVIPYFERFLTRWPTVEAMASAPLDDILHGWQGLGYYARARNLHKCAQTIVRDYGGQFPNTLEGLLRLPGIGPYSASAIGSIGFNIPTPAVDGNAIRVVSRFLGLDQVKSKLYQPVWDALNEGVPKDRPGDYAQSLMDLGSQICTPRNPKCGECPWRHECVGFRGGNPERYPQANVKAPKPTRYGIVSIYENSRGEIYLRRRPEKGLLGGLMEFPSTPWTPEPWDIQDFIIGKVKHTFTHFHLELVVTRAKGELQGYEDPTGIWIQREDLHTQALPTLMKKVADIYFL